jgi:hypothetical protein
MAVVGLLVVAGAWPSLAQPAPDPNGNNGTVKVDGEEFDTHPDNEPHVGCVFEVDFYGFGAGLVATSSFYSWPPTGDGSLLTSINTTLDNDDASGGGSEAGWDGSTGAIDLTPFLEGIDPHPQQGYHVKLQVDVPGGSESKAYSKFKVFWIESCGYEPVENRSDATGGQASNLSTTDTGTSPALPIATVAIVAAGVTGIVMSRRSGMRASRARGR